MPSIRATMVVASGVRIPRNQARLVDDGYMWENRNRNRNRNCLGRMTCLQWHPYAEALIPLAGYGCNFVWL